MSGASQCQDVPNGSFGQREVICDNHGATPFKNGVFKVWLLLLAHFFFCNLYTEALMLVCLSRVKFYGDGSAGTADGLPRKIERRHLEL